MKNAPLDQDPSLFIRLFFSLSDAKRRILITLFKYDKPKGECFPSIRNIAKGARCSERFVKKFFKENSEDLCNLLFEKQYEFCPNTGRQTSNTYYINKTLKQAMSWLDIYGYLRSKKHKMNSIVSHWEKEQSVHPPSRQSVHPLSKDLKNRDKEYKGKGEYVNQKISLIKGISLERKILLSKYPEQAIVDAIDDAVWYEKVKGKVMNPYAFLTAQMQRRSRLRN